MHHFKSTNEFKLMLQSGNGPFGSKLAIFFPCDIESWWMTLENNKTPLLYYIKLWCIISKPWVNSNWSESLETPNSGQNRQFCVPCDLEIWWMTLVNIWAPLLYYTKRCASLQSHGWIQTGVTVRKRPIRVKIDDFLAVLPWNLPDDNNRAPTLSNINLCASFHT